MISKTPCLAQRGPLVRWLLPLMRAVGKAPRVAVFDEAHLVDSFVRQGFEILESRTFRSARSNRYLVARVA